MTITNWTIDPMPRHYHIFIPRNATAYTPVTGFPIHTTEEWDWMRLFIHQPSQDEEDEEDEEDSNIGWRVSEAICGHAVSGIYPTQEAAIEFAQKRLEKYGIKTTKEVVRKQLREGKRIPIVSLQTTKIYGTKPEQVIVDEI